MLSLEKILVKSFEHSLSESFHNLVCDLHHAQTNESNEIRIIKNSYLWEEYGNNYYEKRQHRLRNRTAGKTPYVDSKEKCLQVLSSDFSSLAYKLEEYYKKKEKPLCMLHEKNKSPDYVEVIRALKEKNKFGLLLDFMYYCFAEKYKKEYVENF
ncbi:hypothetical protein COS83_01150 [archaeon CG07_land_8_20_14_0_80_38_8]|nr:MAG: hypothetical protein COS83_01150 [archaeon CG07_land_8_20_14_0_80_38_8]PIU88587.1 MAG: hypothetical protein COS64_03050 [archaeon CG06_land_8_20_14_3_00_37_11]